MTNNAMPDGAVADNVKDTVSPHLTRLLVRAGLAAGLDQSRLAGVRGLAVLDEDGIRIPTTTLLRTWELVADTPSAAGVGRQAMDLWRPGALGVWDYLFSVSGTLGDALAACSRHFTAIADPADKLLLTTGDDDGMTVTFQGPYRDHPQYPLIAELVPHMLLQMASSGVGRRLTPVRVLLPHSVPTASRRHGELYRTTVEYEAGAPSITFAEADVHAPLPRADLALAAILDEHARLSTAAARPVRGWLDRFHAVLENAVADGPPNLDHVAHRLAMSPRTLQRRLRQEDTTWREELERLRQSRVDRLLRETSLSVESIAARVGFSDSRALRRAIHRWYGHGPAAIRASGPT